MNHLSLDTCRRLKEAGFPQETEGAYYAEPSTKDPVTGEYWKTSFMWDEAYEATFSSDYYEEFDRLIACPTCEELLQELPISLEGGYRLRLEGFPDEDIEYTWYACYRYYDSERRSEFGSTPAEALANLYLALKEK